MSTKIFVNLPVKDLPRARQFFGKLGYTFNAQFSSDEGACMVISDDIYAMLLTEAHFKSFTPKPLADAKKTTGVIVALSADSRQEVSSLVEKALANGATRYAEPVDHGFMYQWGFEDPDGHIWEYVWMNPEHVQK
jgi:uncharacterized protein